MASCNPKPRPIRRAPSALVCWLHFAVALVLSLGPGGLERAHVGASHDHLQLASHGRATAAGTLDSSGVNAELSAPCETCRELEWARLSQIGTGAPALSWAPTHEAADRFVPIAEQVRSIASPARIRSRAPPTT